MRQMNRKFILPILALCALSLGGCATNMSTYQNAEGELIVADPFEDVNRGVFAFNTVVDNALFKPVARGYRAAVPKPARTGVRNFLANLRNPISFANNLLQGDVSGAGVVLQRTAINTIFGLGGLIDVAAARGIHDDPEDFGQTLASWGVGTGPYLVVPFLGPATLRDGTGTIVDIVADPVNILAVNQEWPAVLYTRAGLTLLDKREELLDVTDDLEKNSFDYYASMRSVYLQNRESLVLDKKKGAQKQLVEIPDYAD
jgi:phospholipid-binding lipoprotein MlaA